MNEGQYTLAAHTDDTASALLEVVRRFAAESHARSDGAIPVTLDSSLERELCLDSLGRVELLMRIERAFGVSLPEQLLTSAETLRDLLRAVLAATPATAAAVDMPRNEAPERVAAEPSAALTLNEVLDWHVRAHPQRTHITLLDEAGEETTITYAALREGAAKTASGLLERGLLPGQSVALMLPTGRDYFRCFFGVLLAGGVPVWAGLLPQLRRGSRAVIDILYAAYVWTLFWLMAPATWLAAVLLPRPGWSWTASRTSARLFARLTGTPLTVHGLENLPDTPCVLVANHASYLDGIVLAAALPGEISRQFSFVAKRELLSNFVSRTFLQHIGTDFVERFDMQQGVADVQQVATSLQAGRCPIFFPEGTFDRMPGLLPFRIGAFVVAAEAGVPVVPMVIRGTRSILRSDHWFPRRGSITVTVGAPILPDGKGWAAAIHLRNAARTKILQLCREPDLAPVESPLQPQ